MSKSIQDRFADTVALTLQVMEQKAQLDEQAAAAASRLQHLRTQVLPDLAAEIGIVKTTFSDGIGLDVKDKVTAKPKPDAYDEAMAFIEQTEAGLIRTTLTVDIPRQLEPDSTAESPMELAHKLARAIERVCPEAVCSVTVGIHPKSLEAWALRQFKASGGQESLPENLFDANAFRIATLTLPKRRPSTTRGN